MNDIPVLLCPVNELCVSVVVVDWAGNRLGRVEELDQSFIFLPSASNKGAF